MPIKTGQRMHGSVPTLAELTPLARDIEDMMTFSPDGELLINKLPTHPNDEQFVLLVHKLTFIILS